MSASWKRDFVFPSTKLIQGISIPRRKGVAGSLMRLPVFKRVIVCDEGMVRHMLDRRSVEIFAADFGSRMVSLGTTAPG